MLAFYINPKDLAEQLYTRYTNPQQQPQTQGNTYSIRGYSADMNYFTTETWWKNFDWLVNRYPALQSRIQQMRNEGIRDDIINDTIVREVEPRLRFFSNNDNVNKALGRSPKSMEMDRRFQEIRLFSSYKQAFPEKSDQEITNAMWVSQNSGISTTNLLRYPEIFKKVTEGKLLNYQWLKDNPDMSWTYTADLTGLSTEMVRNVMPDANMLKANPIIIGGKNYIVQRDIANVGTKLWKGEISREEAFKQEQELAKGFLPEPIVKSGINPFIQEAAKIMAQGYSTGAKSMIMGSAAALASKGLAYAFGVPGDTAMAYRIGATYAAANELWELAAGQAMLEYSKMNDDNGQPISENAARVAASLDGAVTILAEMFGLPTIARNIPGLSKMLGLPNMDGFSRETLAESLKHSSLVRMAFEQAGKEYGKGITWSTINNLIETISTKAGIPLAQALSKQPFAKYNEQNPIDWKGEISNTLVSSIGGFSIAGLPSLVGNIYTVNQMTQRYSQALNELAETAGTTPQKIEEMFINGIDEAAELASEQPTETSGITAGEAILNTGYGQQTEQTQQETTIPENKQNDNAPPETAPAPAPEQTPQLDTQATTQEPQSDFVFVPSEALANFTEKHPDAVPQSAFQTENETGMTREDFEKLKAQHPEFTNTILNDTRYGPNGVTIAEAVKAGDTADPNTAEAYFSDEIQETINAQRQNYINAGIPEEDANDAAQLFGMVAASALANEGINISPMQILDAEQQTASLNDMSRAEPDYDINNPATWPDKKRAADFVRSAQNASISDMGMFIKNLLDDVLGGKLQEIETETEAETEANGKKKSLTSILREELKDYSRTIKTLNYDAIDALAAREDIDSNILQFGAKFPTRKISDVASSFEFVDYDGRTNIDLASRNGTLFVKVKQQGKRKPFTFAIKNFAETDINSLADTFAEGFTAKGVEMKNAPVFQNLMLAINHFWNEQREKPEIHTMDLQQVDKPEIHTIEKPGTPEVHTPPIWEAMPENPDSDMPAHARYNLAQDANVWGDTVEDILTDSSITPYTKKQSVVMRTPLVFSLVGADVHQLAINRNKLNATKDSILKKHPSVTVDILKSFVSALADPVAIFQSSPDSTNPDGMLALLDIQDTNGASITVPVHLNYDGPNTPQGETIVNKAASVVPHAFTKGSKKGMPDNQWFADQVAAGRLLYINTEKANKWAKQSGTPLLQQGDPIPAGVKTQKDLLNLWTQHDAEGLYKTDPQTGEHVSRIKLFSLSKAVVELLSASKGNVNFATHVHDIGHAMFSIVDGLAEEGSIQMQEDRDYIIGRAGVSTDDYFAEKSIVRGGAREKVHEWFADAFEVYLAQGGKAPNARLQGIFDRTKKKLLELYDDISNQLGIELNEQDRELFDRLLAIPDDASQSVADFAVNEARIKRQQETYQQMIRQEQAELERDKRILDPNYARVRTIRGTEAEVRYKVVDIDSLIASTTELGTPNPDYLQELQPRQRERQASFVQISRIANYVDPELLAESRLASEGAPIVGPDAMVESGNGRILALRQAYKHGKAEGYRNWISENASRFGLDAKDFENITNPVLVRERVSEVDRARFASEANESNIAAMSTTENAVEDAKKITPAMLSLYDPSKPLPANTDFLNSFILVIPENERNAFVQTDGYISRAGLSRALSALTALAYGDSSILSRLNEMYDDDIKNVSTALIQAASKLAILETSNIRPDLSIKKDIALAVNILVNLRQRGKSIVEFFAQPNLFKQDNLSETVKTLIKFFDDNKRSSLRIAEGLRTYAAFADAEPHTNQISIFNVTHSKQEILDAAVAHAQHMNNTESDYTPESLIIAESANKRLANQIQAIRDKSEKQLRKARAKAETEARKIEEKFTARISKIKAKDSEKQEQLKQRLTSQKKEAIAKVRATAAEREAKLKAQFKEHAKKAREKYNERIQTALQSEKSKAIQRIEKLRARTALQLEQSKQQAREQRDKATEKVRNRLQRNIDRLQKRLEKLDALRQRQLERANDKLARTKEQATKKIASRARRIDMLTKRRDRLRSTLRDMHNEHRIQRLIKHMAGMKKSKSISYEKQQELQALFDSLDFSRSKKARKKAKLMREFLNNENGYTADTLQEQGVTLEELEEFAGKIHLADMTLDEVKNIFNQAKEIYEQGRREYEIWKQDRRQRRSEMMGSLVEDITSSRNAPAPRTVKGHEDIVHQYKLGALGETAAYYWDAARTPGRFLQGLGENFRKILDDGFTSRRGEAYSHIHSRIENMLQSLQKLGITPTMLGKTALTLNGENFTWGEVMEIYAGMKNPFSRDAILYGNFMNNAAERNTLYVSENTAMEAINHILDFINSPENENFKLAAELFIKDFDDNFDRIKEAQIRDFNEGLNKQEAYTPIFRLRHQGSGGFQIDAETEQLIANGDTSAVIQKVKNGFTQSRQKINSEKQQPISLNLFSNWYKAMVQQEFYAALGGYAADVFSALTTKTTEHESVQQLIQERVGQSAWDNIKAIYNNSVNDNAALEAEAADKIFGYLTQARSFAYVSFNLASMLSQTTSFFLPLGYTNHAHLFRSLAKFMGMGIAGKGNQFLESVYEKYPELRFSVGDPMMRAMNNIHKYGSASPIMRKVVEWAYKGTSVLDNWTKAVTFDAVYQSKLDEGYSEEEAARLAIRAVQDTQPASSSREMTAFNRSRGLPKLVLFQFMNSLAPVFNVGIVDVARNLASHKWNNIKAAAWSALGAGLAIGFTGVIKATLSGDWPTGKERPDGDTDDLNRWVVDTELENLLNSVPIFNSVLVYLYRKYRGNKQYRSSNRITEPFEALAHAVSSLGGDGEEEDKGFDWGSAFKAMSLMGVPIPYSGGKQIMQWLGVFDDTD